MPIHVGLWVGLGWYSLIRRGDWRAFSWIHLAILWNIINIVKTYKKRKFVQNQREIHEEELFKIIMIKKPFNYFLRKVTVRQKIGNAEGFVKSE